MIELNTFYEKKEYLEQFKKFKKKMKSLNMQQRELEEKIISVKAMIYSDMPRGSSTQKDLSDYIVQLEEINQNIDDLKKIINNKYLIIKRAISIVEDPDESSILHYFYIDDYKWKLISKKTGYSIRQCQRICNSGIDNILFKK